MIVRNLIHWAGPRFDYEPGALIRVSNQVGKDRIAAGIAAKVSEKVIEGEPVHQHESAGAVAGDQGEKA